METIADNLYGQAEIQLGQELDPEDPNSIEAIKEGRPIVIGIAQRISDKDPLLLEYRNEKDLLVKTGHLVVDSVMSGQIDSERKALIYPMPDPNTLEIRLIARELP